MAIYENIEQYMTEEARQELEHHERKRFGVGCAVAVFLFTPILYVLSPPFIVLIFGWSFVDGNPVLEILFAPLTWVLDNFEPVRGVYLWYLSLFDWMR